LRLLRCELWTSSFSLTAAAIDDRRGSEVEQPSNSSEEDGPLRRDAGDTTTSAASDVITSRDCGGIKRDSSVVVVVVVVVVEEMSVISFVHGDESDEGEGGKPVSCVLVCSDSDVTKFVTVMSVKGVFVETASEGRCSLSSVTSIDISRPPLLYTYSNNIYSQKWRSLDLHYFQKLFSEISETVQIRNFIVRQARFTIIIAHNANYKSRLRVDALTIFLSSYAKLYFSALICFSDKINLFTHSFI